ncbi:putative oxidoreductase YjmC [archaeon HR06]|nr:putative oxidoreductase YjmC [archaeon HR06]
MSFGIPAGKERPIIADFATSISAEGKIRVKLARGEKIPLGWVINSEGKLTDDPADLYKGGAILPFGEYKGYAINLLIEALGGALSNGGIADEFIGHNGLFIHVINIDFFTPIEEFKAKIDKMIRKIKSSPLANGFKEILLPGEPELIEMEKRKKNGIPIEEKTWNKIVEVAKKYKVEIPKV